MATDLSVFEIVQVGGIEGNIIASAVACAPSIPYTAAATNLQTALNETADFFLALSGQPKFLGGLDFNGGLPATANVGDYFIFRDSGDRTHSPAKDDVKAGDWLIYTRDDEWIFLDYSFLNVVAENIPYQIPGAVGSTESVADALNKNILDIAANAAAIAGINVEFEEYDSIQDIRNKTGKPIMIYLPTDDSIMATNLRTVVNAMPDDSVVTTVVGDAGTEAYYITRIAYGSVQLWRLSANRAFGQFFSKEGSKVYTVSFDPSATTDIFYKVTPDYDASGLWSQSQTMQQRVLIGDSWNSATKAPLEVTNQNTGAGAPIVQMNSANGTRKWIVDNGGNTEQSGKAKIVGQLITSTSAAFGDVHNSGAVATLELKNTNSQAKFLDCVDLSGNNLFFVKRASNSAMVQVTGTESQLYCQDRITCGGDMGVGGTLTVSGQQVTPSQYIKADSNVFIRTDDETEGFATIKYPLGSNTEGTLRLSTSEQTYNDLWLNCYNEGSNSNATIKLRSSGWGSFSGGTDKDVSYSNTATVGQRYDGSVQNHPSLPSLTVKNASTAYDALTMVVKDNSGNNSLEIGTSGRIKLDGKDARLDVDGDIWNSGHEIHSGTISAGIVNANSMNPYSCAVTSNCSVGGNHSVAGTLSVNGSVVTSSTLTVGSVDIGAKITEYQTKITDLETRLAALEAAAVTYSS